MTVEKNSVIDYYLSYFCAEIADEILTTNASYIIPVTYKSQKALLKISFEEEEIRGNKVLLHWQSKGCATVYDHHQNAILMELLNAKPSLADLAKTNDTKASGIMCVVLAQIHSLPKHPELTELKDRFSSLLLSSNHFPTIQFSKVLSQNLLNNQQECCTLHGDMHHANVLYANERGWLAIDPKSLWGDAAFDYANIFCNPDKQTALSEQRIARQLNFISDNTGIEKERLLQWVIAYSALSAVWSIESSEDYALALGINELAVTMYQEQNY